jgi:ACS family hexuronate transporter-like MFS transporter
MDRGASSGNRAPSADSAAVMPETSSRAGYFWVICALLLFGTTKNYMDRQVPGILKGTLQHDLGWNDIDFGNLVLAFRGAYAVGILRVGRVIDRLGTRLGYALSMGFWSLASMGHALGSSFTSFIVARSALGFGESGVFPASIKTVAEWFPKKERVLATGIFNAGSNLGAIVTPLVVPSIATHWGWRWAFLITGASGFVWFAFWLLLYRRREKHPRVSAELDYIRSDPQPPVVRIKWARLIPHRQTWAFLVAKFMTDPIWWSYLFWIPDFLQRRHGLALMNIRLPIVSDLCDRGYRQRRGRLVLVLADPAWRERKPQAKEHAADLRGARCPYCVRL